MISINSVNTYSYASCLEFKFSKIKSFVSRAKVIPSIKLISIYEMNYGIQKKYFQFKTLPFQCRRVKELVVFIMVAVRCLTIKPYVAALRVLTVRNVKVNIRNIFHLKINYNKQHELKLSIFLKTRI